MNPAPDDVADAQFLYDIVVSMRKRHSVTTGRDHVLLRRALELVWEKPRERGETYGQYRHSFYWSPAALKIANRNLKDSGFTGDRGLIKEHVVPYQELVNGLLDMHDDGRLTPQTLGDAARQSLHSAVITTGQDKKLRLKLKRFVNPDPWDLTNADQVWIRYSKGGLDPSTFSTVQYAGKRGDRPRFRKFAGDGRIPGLSTAAPS